jgi:hypothetical protein
MKFDGNVVSWVVVLMAASSLFSMVCLLQIDRVVHNELYRYGLQFSYEWATLYWTVMRTAFALGWFNIIAAITVQLYTVTFRRKEVEQLVTEVEKEILKTETMSQEGQESTLPQTTEEQLLTTITQSETQEKMEEKRIETEDKLREKKTGSKQPTEVDKQVGQASNRACHILRTLPRDKAFYFYEGVGKPTGEFAESLLDFRNKIMTLQLSSLIFHLKRKDLENWIKEIIGDSMLAERISEIEPNAFLKMKLQSIIDTRIMELKEMLPNQPVSREEYAVTYATVS